jgi:hypothetical protein
MAELATHVDRGSVQEQRVDDEVGAGIPDARRAVGQLERGDVVPGKAADVLEAAADEQPRIVQRQGVDRSVRVRIPRGSRLTGGVDLCQMVPHQAAGLIEAAAQVNHRVVGGQRLDRAVRSGIPRRRRGAREIQRGHVRA